LREQIAARLRARGAEVAADDVLVTNGAQQAIAIAVGLVCRAGEAITVDAQTYPSALDLFRSAGVVPVTSDEPRVAYVMPAVANPTGQALAPQARRHLLERPDRLFIEDDAYAELSFAGPPPPPLLAEARARTLHVGTLSKILCPGLRVGWLVVPPRYRVRARRLKQSSDLQAGGLAQFVVSDFLDHDDLDRRIRKLRRFYRNRAAHLLRALGQHAPGWRFTPPIGGFSVWVETNADAPEEELLSQALAQGVSFDPGSSFRPEDVERPLAFRLCYSTADPARFGEAVRRLSTAWRRVRASAARRSPSARPSKANPT
jgi:2-aminoadipate transaminase